MRVWARACDVKRRQIQILANIVHLMLSHGCWMPSVVHAYEMRLQTYYGMEMHEQWAWNKVKMLSKQLDNIKCVARIVRSLSLSVCPLSVCVACSLRCEKENAERIIMMIKWKFVACVIIGFPADISQGITSKRVGKLIPSICIFNLAFLVSFFSVVFMRFALLHIAQKVHTILMMTIYNE